MRTRDFSRAPAQANAESMVLWEVRGFSAWRTALRAVRSAPGYRWHSSRVALPSTFVVAAFFETAGHTRAFAATLPADATPRTGGFATVFSAEADGYSNGVWRAEGNTMAHIERFTPLSGEVARGKRPPRVADNARSDNARSGDARTGDTHG